ncbi:hypothetical protein M9H77_13451 [Catharanthus roseus]|uniref:Uncharacterized protein n=1 Tax=Catharanthus roseus TaxID=4058 RepID=A0ACC0BK67_CATRO|nr:hypothetical protein M9H77_13451 [Catharanthus roseus]
MEEVPGCVHPGPIVPDIWTWSRVRVLQPQLLRHVQQDPLAPLGAMWCTLFDCNQLPTHVLLTNRDQLDFMSSDQRQHIKGGTMLPVEELSNPTDDYIRGYRDITRVYIGNPTNRDTRTAGYQPVGVEDG